MFKAFSVLAFVLFCWTNQAAQTATTPLLVGRVAHNQTRAFTCAGKIWLIDKNGGAAKRLTNTPNEEPNPIFSPDGRQIAFSRSNGSDWDVFVMPADGRGEARRITMMPENDFLTAWTPDGRSVVFESTRDEETVFRLYQMNVENPTLAVPLPQPQGSDGAGPRGPYFFTPRLVDGGRVQLPNRAAFVPDGTSRGIENTGGERIELLPDASVKDKFVAQTASVSVTFERDAGGKFTGVTVVLPNGREIKGKKIN